MNLNHQLIYSLGIQESDLACRAEHLKDGVPLSQQIVLESWKGIKNYPLSIEQKNYLRNRLLAQQAIPALWKVSHPTVAIYRWSNNELRYFLITRDGHLLEDQCAEEFLIYFPILKKLKDSQYILSGHGRQIEAPHLDLCWLPQNQNYSHFLCDYLGPLIDLKGWEGIDRPLALLCCEAWQAWQKDFLKRLPLSYAKIPSPHPGELMFIKPRSVNFPILSNIMQSQLNLRDWLYKTVPIKPMNENSTKIPILITRKGPKQMRIRNQLELEKLVKSYSGICIDPSPLSLKEKLELFEQASLIIGDGSSSMNTILFASDKCKYIGLSATESITNNHYLEGGWPYTHLIASRSTFIVGEDTTPLPGSTLGSSIYPSQLIENTLKSLQEQN